MSTDTPDTASAVREHPDREYDVPTDADTYACPYCEDVQPTEQFRDLHVGIRHEDDATEEELETFDRTFDRESNEVFIYHLKVISGVVAIYFVFLFTYSAVI